MIIVEEHADSKLIKALEALRPDPEGARAIHFKFSEKPEWGTTAKELRPMIAESFVRHLHAVNGQTFLCGDGDIFILAPILSTKEARTVMLDVAELMKATADDQFAVLYECKQHLNKMLALLEVKIERSRKQVEALRKQQEEATAAKKRKEILEIGSTVATDNFVTRRKNRTTTEIMIIEDDAFSRKLVENALQKQYNLTALGTADVALATYANLAPDILFLDINLPDVTGHELLEKIIRMDPAAYVIMLSGNSDKQNIMQAMNAGAKGFVGKPFTKEKLLQYIERCPT